MISSGVVVLSCVGAAAWIGFRGQQAAGSVRAMRLDGDQLQRQLADYDLVGAATTMTSLRQHADRAHRLTADPVWVLAGVVPVIGRDVRAAREASTTVAQISNAAEPLESALPKLDPSRPAPGGARVDVSALAQLSAALPSVSAAVSSGADRMASIDPAALRPDTRAGVQQLQDVLNRARGPLADAAPTLADLPPMLGSDGRRNWLVLLQQDAEARGTGGLVGSFAVVSADKGRLTLEQAAPRSVLAASSVIPASAVPDDLRNLWGPDITDWAGLNLSPNFPWTGQLVAAGWKAGAVANHRPALDYVAGVDQYVVAGMLAGTGPVTVQGVTVTSANAVDFLSRGVYSRWKDPRIVDAVTAELVQATFARFASGHLNVPALIKGMTKPVQQRRLLIWSAHPDEQQQIADLSIGGTLPDNPGPFAMAVVNNGGGNKLDAYLKVHTTYAPGVCAQGTRVGHIVVDLDNTAPSKGLPEYVSVRSDLKQNGLHTRAPAGSNRVLLDVYGPIGAQSALTTLDGGAVQPVLGLDRGHTVWRVAVPIDPGQRRQVDVVVAEPMQLGGDSTAATVLTQAMVNPATAKAEPSSPCPATG